MSQPAAETTVQPARSLDGESSHRAGLRHGQTFQSPEEKAEEAQRIRRLQRMVAMVMHVIQQDKALPVERASALVADARRAALAMFPDKAQAFDMLYWPGLQRTMRERYRMQ
jgi:hypothetical protein